MRIQHVEIRNFRSLKEVVIDFDDVTTFIGPNGTGKSSVLRALDWFFNGTKNGDLTEKDCSFGAIDEDIEVQVTFIGLTDADRAVLGKYAANGIDTFTAWKRRTPDGRETLTANAKGLPAFTEIKNGANPTEKKALYAVLREEQPQLELPVSATGPKVDEAITAWEASHLDQLENVPEVQTNFFGFNSNGKMSGLFDFVLVAADMRASEESQDSRASIIGRILERSVDRTAADEEIAAIVEQSRLDQQRVYGEKFTDQLGVMTERLNEVVSGYSLGRTVSVRPSDVELKAPRTTFDVTVIDGTTETPVERQGHGFQRTLLISALQVLAQSSAASADGVICLAVEEPELFQHPIQAQAFAKVLRALAEDAGRRIQVMYATHSPYFVEARHFDQIRRLTRATGSMPTITVHSSTVSVVKAALDGIVGAAQVDRQLDGTVSNQLSVALFASRALLVEGTTEQAVLYGIGDRGDVGILEAQGTSIVSVGGKMNIPLAHAILNSIGIPTYAMFDADTGFEARARAKGKSDDKVSEERQGHVAANRKLLRYFGLVEDDFPPETVSERVAILSDHLEGLLTTTWPEWVASCAQLETDAGISLEKNQDAYRAATRGAGGDPFVSH